MNRLFTYLQESRTELGKVQWPSRKQTIRLTIVVIAFSVVLAAFIAGVDYVFSQVVQKVILKG